MAVTWLPNQASFIGALDAGAQAGMRSAALRQQAMAQQAAIDEANARQQAAIAESQNRLNFEAWLRGEQLRQQAAQDEMLRDKYEQEFGLNKQKLQATMATEAAKQAYWNNRGSATGFQKPFTLSEGAMMLDSAGNVIAKNPRTPKTPMVTVTREDTTGAKYSLDVPAEEYYLEQQISDLEKSLANPNDPYPRPKILQLKQQLNEMRQRRIAPQQAPTPIPSPMTSPTVRTNAQPGYLSSQAVLDMPKSKADMITGMRYNTRNGVATWDGNKFVQ